MKNMNRLLYLLALIKFALPFFLQNAMYEPHRDEFLYLAEGHHMAWGYMEVPPLLSVFAWLTNLFGGGMFWIKAWPSLFGALTYLLTGKIILSLGGRSFALFLGFLPYVFGGFLRVHFLFQPNCLEVFFWTMLAWATINYVQTAQPRWLYVFGISAGLGMLSKYSVSFFIVSLLIGLLLTPQRKIFRERHLYFAALIGFIIFLPNLLWQYHYHFPVVFHMRELQETQLQYLSPVNFLSGQLVMHLPVCFIWLMGLWVVGFSAAGKPYRFLGWAYVAVIVLLLAGRGKDYYALGVYPVLFAFGAWGLERITANRFKFVRFVFVITPFLFAVPFIPVALPVFPPGKLDTFYRNNHTAKLGVLKWEDGKNHPLPQDFADMLGWEEMARKAGAAYATLDSNEKKETIFYCDNYGQAGAVNFYAAKYHLPQAYSDNASFLYWMPDTLHVENLLLITDDVNEMQHPFIRDFKEAILVDSIANPYAREHGSLILILKGGDAAFKKMYREKIEKARARVSF